MRKKKRAELCPKEVEIFTREYVEIITTFPGELVLNMDETAWNFVFKRGEVFAEIGVEEVEAGLPDDFRKSFTVITTISAAGEKFPPLFLAKGKTPICHRQFNGMETNRQLFNIFHSPGGNTDDDAMEFYLDLVKDWVGSLHCVLILDRYPSHTSARTRENAAKRNIRLVFIPKSGTEKFQPLDRRVFGVLKSSAASKFCGHVFQFQRGSTKSEAADIFMECWKRLNPSTVRSAWNIDGEDEEDEEVDSSDSEFEINSSNDGSDDSDAE